MSKYELIRKLRRNIILFAVYFVIAWVLDMLFAKTPKSLAEISFMSVVFTLFVQTIEYVTNKKHKT